MRRDGRLEGLVVADLKYLPPILRPSKILALALNFREDIGSVTLAVPAQAGLRQRRQIIWPALASEETEMVQASGVDHVVLHCSDVERSKTFYTEILGMSVSREDDRRVFLQAGKG